MTHATFTFDGHTVTVTGPRAQQIAAQIAALEAQRDEPVAYTNTRDKLREDWNAWREEYRRRQEAGERFEYYSHATGTWSAELCCEFTMDQDQYRPIRHDVEHVPAGDTEGDKEGGAA